MTGNAVNAKSDALDLHELSFEKLDAVSGGTPRTQENREQFHAAEAFKNALQGAGAI